MVTFESDAETHISAGVSITGDFSSAGTIQFDGKLNGTLNTQKSALIGKEAVIEGNIDADNALILGHVQGNIKANGTLELGDSAVVKGNLQSGVISIREGAHYEGTVSMGNSGVAAPTEAVSTETPSAPIPNTATTDDIRDL